MPTQIGLVFPEIVVMRVVVRLVERRDVTVEGGVLVL
jgi:hypothetical protein